MPAAAAGTSRYVTHLARHAGQSGLLKCMSSSEHCKPSYLMLLPDADTLPCFLACCRQKRFMSALSLTAVLIKNGDVNLNAAQVSSQMHSCSFW